MIEPSTPRVASSTALSLSNDGWALERSYVGERWVEEARSWFAGLSAQRDLSMLEPEFDGDVLRKVRRLYWSDPERWRAWIVETGLATLASSILGGAVSLRYHAAFLKPAQVGSEVGFHQDQALWERDLPHAVSCWVALDEARCDNGALAIVSGSHRRRLLPHHSSPDHAWHDVVAGESLDPPVVVEADPGDVVIWDRYTVHGSSPNRSDRARRSMVLVFSRCDSQDQGDPTWPIPPSAANDTAMDGCRP